MSGQHGVEPDAEEPAVQLVAVVHNGHMLGRDSLVCSCDRFTAVDISGGGGPEVFAAFIDHVLAERAGGATS